MLDSERITDQVIERLPIGEDLELHVKLTYVDRRPLVQLRVFTPSEKHYGRGVILEPTLVGPLIEALRRATVLALT
jgi:hypothetical protein